MDLDRVLDEASKAQVVRLPFPIGTYVKDIYTGYEGTIVGYTVYSDLTLTADVNRIEDGQLKGANFPPHRLTATKREL
jgi:hypothetical protein